MDGWDRCGARSIGGIDRETGVLCELSAMYVCVDGWDRWGVASSVSSGVLREHDLTIPWRLYVVFTRTAHTAHTTHTHHATAAVLPYIYFTFFARPKDYIIAALLSSSPSLVAPQIQGHKVHRGSSASSPL